MRDRSALVVLVVVATLLAGGYHLVVADLPPEAAPDATFEVSGDADGGELVVEHVDGEAVASGSVTVLVYEDRRYLPDRTVHGTVWEVDAEAIGPGDRIVLEDPRFERGQRLVVRWFGDEGRANLHETRI